MEFVWMHEKCEQKKTETNLWMTLSLREGKIEILFCIKLLNKFLQDLKSQSGKTILTYEWTNGQSPQIRASTHLGVRKYSHL